MKSIQEQDDERTRYYAARECLRVNAADAIEHIADAIRTPAIGCSSLIAARTALDKAYLAALITDPE